MTALSLTPQQISVSLENKDGELRLDSRIVADGFGLPNHTSYRTNVLMKYESTFAELGVIDKMTLETGEIVWYLTEEQAKFAVGKSRRGLTDRGIQAFIAIGWEWALAFKSQRKRAKVSEKDYSDALAVALNGKREVGTLAGNIDVLTSTQVIEVKAVKQWKAALGQVLVYSHYYPSHSKRIHLYGETQESFLDLVEKHVSKLGVIVTWEG